MSLARRGRVLIVEDHRDSRDLYADYFRFADWDVREVPDGEAAVEAVSSFEPDVVVMDLMLPITGGLEAIQRIKALPPPARDVPIVVLTAWVEKIGEALQAGCVEFVAKPCLPGKLREVVNRVVATALRARPAS